MSCQSHLDAWTTCMRTHLPALSKPQATVLALWSLGMVLARSCALSAVSVWLAARLKRKNNTVRQQLREWCYEAPAKRGDQRQALAVEPGFVPLLRWVLGDWQGTQLALADRAARLWLAVAVATLWLLSVGGLAEATIPASTLLDVTNALAAQRRATRLRLVSIFRRGWITILVALLNHAPLPRGAFLPEPWPRVPSLAASQGVSDPEVHYHVAA